MKVNDYIKQSKGDNVYNIIISIIILISGLIILIPLVHILAASFSSPKSVIAGKVLLWPSDFSLEGYKAVFKNSKILTGYYNTIIYTVLGTLYSVTMTVCAAFSLSNKSMPGRTFFTFLFTFTMIFNGGLIPTYLLNSQLGLLNTRAVMIIPGAITVWNLMLAKNYFQNSISHELWEAAQIDGCNDFVYFLRIAIPLAKPIIAVLVLFYSVERWNAFFNAFIYLNNQKLMPLQIVLRDILVSNQVDASSIMDYETLAAKEGLSDLLKYSTIIVASLPMWILYPFVQKYFVKGIMVGSIKG